MGVVFECVHDDIAQQARARPEVDGDPVLEIGGDRTSDVLAARPNASACEAQMRRVSRLHAAFPSASAPLQKACAEEFSSLCSGSADTPPRHGPLALAQRATAGPLEERRQLACIRKHEARLSDHCRAKATAIERIAHRELAHNAEVGGAVSTGDSKHTLSTHCAEAGGM